MTWDFFFLMSYVPPKTALTVYWQQKSDNLNWEKNSQKYNENVSKS